ncbi:MAG: hypothetical protein ABI592_10745 [Acidobacteriota bacterium]
MDWVTCPKCGFTQIPTESCLRCAMPFDLAGAPATPAASSPSAAPPPPAAEPVPVSEASDGPSPVAAPATAPELPSPAPDPTASGEDPPTTKGPARRRVRTGPAVAAAAVLLAVVALLIARSRSGSSPAAEGPAVQPTSPSGALDLSGRWETEFSKTLPGSSPRPALKQVFLETDHEGSILAAGVLLTDPGRGGAGAGYRVVADGSTRLEQISTLVAASPSGAALPIDFIPFPAWMPGRERLWRVLEGQSRRSTDVRYLLLESVEDDYLVQAGINRTGFLSYAFFSREYAHNRGLDALSAIIHPEAGSSLRGFRNLVWDLSGSADFLTLEVYAALSGPEGTPDKLTLKRAEGSGQPSPTLR